MRVTRITTDAAGESCFDVIDIPLLDAGEIGCLSAPFAARSVIFRETEPDYDYDWHPAPQRQLIVLLDGAIEIEVGSGETRRFGGGDILLVEDTTGRGHRTRTTDGQRRRSLFIPLGDSTEL
jgi:hypothetical protein